METLYELLGALPGDNAEGLRTAFRTAVKGSHPDINPGDPDAALKFRRIVRANEILADNELRAAYDHLLVLADIEREERSSRAFAAKIHRLATGAMALAVASLVSLGGYEMFDHLNTVVSRPAPPAERETFKAEAAMTPMVADLVDMPGPLTEMADLDRHKKQEGPGESEAADAADIAASAVVPVAGSAAPAADVAGADDLAPPDASRYRAQAMAAYRKGDLNLALVKLDLAIAQNPASSDAYVDRGIVHRRLGDMKRAYADIAKAKGIDDLNRRKSAAAGGP